MKTVLSILPSSPVELGFPEKYDTWRQGQAETIEETIFSDRRVVVNCAPTGFGKSQCYMTEAQLEPGRTCIIVKTKGLSDQLMKDYSSMGLVEIRGKDNYTCDHKPGWTCKDGMVGGCSLKGSARCGFSRAYNTARERKNVVTTFKMWIAIHKYGDGLGQFSRLIFDEADTCPDELADSVQVNLSFKEIEELLGLTFPRATTTGDEWKQWACLAKVRAQTLSGDKQAQIQKVKDPRPSWIRDYHHLKNMVQKLHAIAFMRQAEWVWEEFDWGWQFDPIKFHRFTESRLFLKVPKISLYSATIRPRTTHMLGIADRDVLFIEHEPVFDPARSPVYFLPTQRVDSKNPDITALVMNLDRIGRPRLSLHRNGIIHVTSFDYRDKIVQMSDFRHLMVSHYDKSPVIEAIERFRAQGGALISPSISTGYDFRDDECRWQVLTKIPFQPQTRVIKARQAVDKLYGPFNAMRAFVQQTGRGTRSADDWCENFLLDSHAEWFMRAYSFLAPKSFWRRYRQINMPPAPIQI